MTDRDEARRLLRELLPELLDEALGARPSPNGHHAADGNGTAPAPQVPAAPVAAVLRPSTWSAPPAPGEVIGDSSPTPSHPLGAPVPSAPPGTRGSAEPVVLDTDEDLDRFVRALVARFENPRDRMAIRSGALRFTLRRSASPAAGAPAAEAVMRVEKGAVTERTVREAADKGARLVLAPAAVLTPLARDKARALKVPIERERRC
jgi:hypothetical protein